MLGSASPPNDQLDSCLLLYLMDEMDARVPGGMDSLRPCAVLVGKSREKGLAVWGWALRKGV